MTAKMEEGFRKEELPDNRQKEMKAGVKNEANARQIVQNDSQAIKDEIRQLESGSGSGGCWKKGHVVRSQVLSRQARKARGEHLGKIAILAHAISCSKAAIACAWSIRSSLVCVFVCSS